MCTFIVAATFSKRARFGLPEGQSTNYVVVVPSSIEVSIELILADKSFVGQFSDLKKVKILLL